MTHSVSSASLLQALTSGGDHRIALDSGSGRNRYLCPALPTLEMACVASCTASPISAAGLRAAALCADRLGDVPSAARLAAEAQAIAAAIIAHFGVADLAEALLTPSGTDAALLATALLAAERPGKAFETIMCEEAENGSFMNRAASGCHFATPAMGALHGMPDHLAAQTVKLRQPDGLPRNEDSLRTALRAAVLATRVRPIIHLMDCSKTGLAMPMPAGEVCDVVVDACQARLDAGQMRRYLSRGWPVLLTGSKFYGGPAFSGAVLFPRDRLAAIRPADVPRGIHDHAGMGTAMLPASPHPGMLLRWQAALAEMALFANLPIAAQSARIAALAATIEMHAAAVPGLMPIRGASRPTIFAFGISDPHSPGHLLSKDALGPLYRDLAAAGVLVGQPVTIGEGSGALRVAIGARMVTDEAAHATVATVFAGLARLTEKHGPTLSRNCPTSGRMAAAMAP